MFSDRTAALIGEEGIEKLRSARVAVFGIGGVGGYVAEALARSGFGHIDLIDSDVVTETNINRQIIALTSTLGKPKAEVMRERIADINPSAEVVAHNLFYSEETADSFDLGSYDYVADAIDSVKSKLALIKRALASGTPVISAMGAGNKLDPTRFRVTDISKTTNCPLARVIRRELRASGINHLTVVASDEAPKQGVTDSETGKSVPASIIYCPAVAGLLMAYGIIEDIISRDKQLP